MPDPVIGIRVKAGPAIQETPEPALNEPELESFKEPSPTTFGTSGFFEPEPQCLPQDRNNARFWLD